jgi:hypothetical protein
MPPKKVGRQQFLAVDSIKFVCCSYFQAYESSLCFFYTHTEVWVIKKQREKAKAKASEHYDDIL